MVTPRVPVPRDPPRRRVDARSGAVRAVGADAGGRRGRRPGRSHPRRRVRHRRSSRGSLPTGWARGSVVGIDRSPEMLAVAERLRPDLEWREADASGLPFLARSFDVVLCQAALMCFPDPGGRSREMARAIKDDGTVAIQVWDRLDAQPAYRRSSTWWPVRPEQMRRSSSARPSLGETLRAAGALATAGLWPSSPGPVGPPAVRIGRRVRDDGAAEDTARRNA